MGARSLRVCVVLTARPSWAKLSPVCKALSAIDIDLQIVCCASALLERFGNVSAVVEREYPIAERVFSVYEGSTLETSAIEVGALQSALAHTYARLRPDLVVVCADRREILAAAAAARMQEIKILHLQGGECSGSVDDDIRDAVTQLADYHCVATKCAAMRVYGLTGRHDRITVTGCPSIDIAHQAQSEPSVTVEELGGAGRPTRLLDRRFLVWLQHPVTSEVADASFQMYETFRGIHELTTVALWPGEDAGADAMSKVLRGLQDEVHTVRNLPPSRFLKLLTQASCLVGNSSAGIREASYLGVPVVNIGSRQHGRERAKNVIDVPHDAAAIHEAVACQIGHGLYPSSSLYGRGDAGQRIAEVIRGI